MSERIVLDPALGITPVQFVEVWNSNSVYANEGTAHVDATATPKSMDLAVAGYAVVSGIAFGLLTNLTYDLIKAALAGRKKQTQFTVREVPQNDGTKLLVVVVEK
ncbi:MAG: hypothetical protein AAF639_34275 [Chloroflexota bacterium]